MMLASGKNKHPAIPMPGNLYDDMGRSAKTVQAKILTRLDLTQPQRSVSDNTGAQ
jgi:hypothetical protein